MSLGLDTNTSILQDGTKINFIDNNIKPANNDNRYTSYSEGIQSKIDPKSLKGREVSIQKEAAEMRKTDTKRSKTILAVGLVAGAIAGIVGGALALAGIATMIPFIIAGISIFAGIFLSIASLPETDQMYEARLTVKYVKEALTSNDKEKAGALRYINNILDTTKDIGDKEVYIYEERNNLLRLAVKAILDENKEEIISCLNNNDSDVKSSAINLLSKAISRKDLSKEAKEILERLNLGVVKKMIHNESTRNEMLDLLWLMSKDEDLKKVVNKLVGSDIADKLANLNSQSTIEGKNKIIEEIKGLKLGPQKN